MIRSSQGRLVFQPITLTFGVTPLGGAYAQSYSVDNGQYEPDRSLTPLVLAPSLMIVDPDFAENSGEKSGKLTNVNWQVSASSNSGTWQIGKDYVVDENNRLIVYGNLKQDSVGKIQLTANYYDNVRARVNTLNWECRLTCKSIAARKFDLRCAESGLNRLDAFRLPTTYTLNAQMSNNGTDVADADAVYKWQVLSGNAFVDIVPTRDLWYRSGAALKTLTIAPAYIGNVCVRCTAYHKSFPAEKFYKSCRLVRYYGQYEDSWLWINGQLKFIDTAYAEGRVVINRKHEGEISNPERFFDIEVFYDNDNGMGWQHVAHGARGRVGRNMFPVDAAHRDRFGWAVREKTELQALTINGESVTLNGEVAVLSVPAIPRD